MSSDLNSAIYYRVDLGSYLNSNVVTQSCQLWKLHLLYKAFL